MPVMLPCWCSEGLNTMENPNITAEIIADSKNEFGKRLTTFVLQFPRIVLAEFNTHRMLSRNSASSRAVPTKIMLERIQDNPFIPTRWMKEHKGMQGNEYMNKRESEVATSAWLVARDRVVHQAKYLLEKGATKQIINRLLEPWMYHVVIASATEWENFFALRAHRAAEIHIQELAYKMLNAYNKSKPKQLKTGEWHIPFGDKMRDGDIFEMAAQETGLIAGKAAWDNEAQEIKVKIAVARCARVSYINYEGKDDYDADIKLHNQLAMMGHWSPFEHCAAAAGVNWSGNFHGFVQYRKMFENENRTDDRIK